jgi:hypothetical protein
MIFINSHILIGKHIQRTINNTLPVSISLSCYLYGCTIPDILPRYSTVPHCKEQSLDLVSSLISKTLKTLPESAHELQKYSFELGIITHYICDYFCQPHNAVYIKPLEHARYENRLAQKFKQADLKSLTIPIIIAFDSANPTQWLMEYLEYQWLEYLNHPPDMLVDIRYSVQTSTTIILSILNNSLTLAHRAA